MMVKVKEPFLLVFSVAWIVFFIGPWTLRHKDGTPHRNQLTAKIAGAAIGLAMLGLWLSLPSQ